MEGFIGENNSCLICQDGKKRRKIISHLGIAHKIVEQFIPKKNEVMRDVSNRNENFKNSKEESTHIVEASAGVILDEKEDNTNDNAAVNVETEEDNGGKTEIEDNDQDDIEDRTGARQPVENSEDTNNSPEPNTMDIEDNHISGSDLKIVRVESEAGNKAYDRETIFDNDSESDIDC